MTRDPDKRRRLAAANFGRLALLAGGCVAALVLAEVIVRALSVAPEVVVVAQGRYRVSANPSIGYEPIPGLMYDGEPLTNYDYRSEETNSLGYRDRERQLARAPGVLRVVVLGDSVAMGLWIDKREDTFPAKLETYLNRQGRPAEVLNFGVVGYNTLQEVATLEERGLAFGPDVVLVEYCLNDRQRDDGNMLGRLVAAEKGERSLSAARLSRFMAWSALYRFFRFRVMAGFAGTYRDTLEVESQRLQHDTVTEALATLGSLARAHRFKVLLVVFPDFSDLHQYRFGEEHQTLRLLSASEGFTHLDLLRPMRQCEARGMGQSVALDRYHPTAYGNDCAARAMAAAVASMK
ncbi:MAG: SGNH/GDSL hydrolase family protein [Vicinamibacteria bacterium]|nr:SGNH/GDSL hydrolase family protein [Vicinamibacteria bacterium]